MSHRKSTEKSPKPRSPIDAFIALPDAEKERIYQEIDAKTPQQLLAESRPLNRRERQQWAKFRKKMGRPKIGKGAKIISLTVERDLLKQADALAKQEGVSRAQIFARGLRSVLKAS
jgi:hypothetical protein